VRYEGGRVHDGKGARGMDETIDPRHDAAEGENARSVGSLAPPNADDEHQHASSVTSRARGCPIPDA
jgi:hypothetical protein